jgi:hypothetical protein
MDAIDSTVRHLNKTDSTTRRSEERRRLDALRRTLRNLWSMDIPEDKMKTTYRVDRKKLMTFGPSTKKVADISLMTYLEMENLNPGGLQSKVETLLKTRKFTFTTYELDMRKFLEMQKTKPEHADVFAACNSEMFPHHEQGISVEMYALKYGILENKIERMLDEAEKELLIKMD